VHPGVRCATTCWGISRVGISGVRHLWGQALKQAWGIKGVRYEWHEDKDPKAR
jgi:hypothetical protein